MNLEALFIHTGLIISPFNPIFEVAKVRIFF